MVNNSVYPTYTISNFITLKKSLWQSYWQWLWVVAFIGGLIFVVRDVHSQQINPIQLGVIHRPLSVLVIGFFILPWLFKYKKVMLQGYIAPLTIFSIWQILSTIWSDNTLWTFYRSIEYFVIVMLTAYTVASLKNLSDVRKWMNWVWIWLAVLVASVWLGIVIFPGATIGSLRGTVPPFMICGVVPVINPNSISHLGGVLAIVGLCRLFENGDKKWSILIAWGIVTMILSHGRSGLAGFVIALILVLVLYRRMGLTLGILLTIATLVITVNFEILFVEFFRRGQSYQLFSTFSGRLNYWKYAWSNFIIQRPLLGYGAFAGTRFLVMPEILSTPIASSTHNSWMELLVNVGFFGAIVFLLVIVCIWFGLILRIRNAHDTVIKSISIEALAVLTVLLVRSFFTTALVEHSQYPFFIAIGVLEFLRRYKVKSS